MTTSPFNARDALGDYLDSKTLLADYSSREILAMMNAASDRDLNQPLRVLACELKDRGDLPERDAYLAR